MVVEILYVALYRVRDDDGCDEDDGGDDDDDLR